MCGRYTLELTTDFRERFDIVNDLKGLPQARYNIAPGQTLPVITRNSPKKIEIMLWGLIPFWSKDAKNGMINARAETLAAKPTFRQAFEKRRCLVPATGFYEWKRSGKEKIPFHFRFKDKRTFAFAGIYEVWKNSRGEEIKTYAIITTTPDKLMEPIHNRMPVILERQTEEDWLSPSSTPEKLLDLLKPYPDGELETYPVSARVNTPAVDEPSLLDKEK